MNPVSRGRKKSQSRRSGGERVLRTVAPAPEACDCPNCSGAELDPSDLIDDLIAGGGVILGCEDPLEVEMFAANLLAVGNLAGEGFAEALTDGIVPTVEQLGTREALAVLLAIAAVEEGTAAAEAAQRLTGSGIPEPSWAPELRAPVTPGEFIRFADDGGNLSVLVGTFARAGRSHGFSLNVVHGDCFSAAEVLLFPGEVLDQVVDMIQNNEGARDLTITRKPLQPADFRWESVRALDARADHDAELDDPTAGIEDPEDADDQGGPGYHLLAELLRVRLRLLPESSRPPAQHGI